MTTMTERAAHKRLVDLSVVTLSALLFGGGYLLASSVDRERARLASMIPEETAQPASGGVELIAAPPVPGLRPAARPTRRVVIVRRTRAS